MISSVKFVLANWHLLSRPMGPSYSGIKGDQAWNRNGQEKGARSSKGLSRSTLMEAGSLIISTQWEQIGSVWGGSNHREREGHLGQMLSAGLKHLVAYLWMLVLPKQPQVTGQEKDQLVLTISLVWRRGWLGSQQRVNWFSGRELLKVWLPTVWSSTSSPLFFINVGGVAIKRGWVERLFQALSLAP